MVTSIPAELSEILDQALEVRERFPALYHFLATRERALDRALKPLPHPNDMEGWLVFDAREHARRHLLHIPPGVCDLARIGERQCRRLTRLRTLNSRDGTTVD